MDRLSQWCLVGIGVSVMALVGCTSNGRKEVVSAAKTNVSQASLENHRNKDIDSTIGSNAKPSHPPDRLLLKLRESNDHHNGSNSTSEKLNRPETISQPPENPLDDELFVDERNRKDDDSRILPLDPGSLIQPKARREKTPDIHPHLIDVRETPQLQLAIGKAFGFHAALEYQCERLQQLQPKLSDSVRDTKYEFDKVYGKGACRLTSLIGESAPLPTEQLKKKLRSSIAANFDAVPFTQERAHSMLDQIRAWTDQPSTPELRLLLAFQHEFDPAAEFFAGHKQGFNSDSHENAKGLAVRFEAPRSWTPTETARPNIVAHFKSFGGVGRANVMLMIRNIPIPPGQEATPQFHRRMIKNSLSPEAVVGQFHKAVPMTIDGLPAVMQVYSTTRERLNMTIELYSVFFTVLYRDKAISLGCVLDVTGLSTTDSNALTAKYIPLFRLLANSLVITDQYRSRQSPQHKATTG